MPKIRIKRASNSYLEKFANKSYETSTEGITTFTTSGSLNTNYKKKLNKQFNQGGKYFRIEQMSEFGDLVDQADYFDDTSTINFLENDKCRSIINAPAVNIKGTKDFYITSDEFLLNYTLRSGQTAIPLSAAKHAHMRLSDCLVDTPNFLDLDKFITTSTSSNNILNLTRENVKEDKFKPFKEKDIYENLTSSMKNESIIYEGEEYNIGEQKRIEIELDFTEAVDAYLLNTQMFYRNNEFYSTINAGEPTGSIAQKDDVYITDQVNFLSGSISNPGGEAVSSHFLPNMLWNNIEKRWEYNVATEYTKSYIDSNEDAVFSPLHVNSWYYNDSLGFTSSGKQNSYLFPNFLSHTYHEGDVSGESYTNASIFNHLKYIETSPICFSKFYSDDAFYFKNSDFSPKDNSYKYSTLYNVPVKTYGFPNSSLWKTDDNHSISMKKYLANDFIVEKIFFEGEVDVKAQRPLVNLNLVSHHTNVFNESNISDIHLINTSTSEIGSRDTSVGINFYLLNKTKHKSQNKPNNDASNITGFVYRKETDIFPFKDFEAAQRAPLLSNIKPYVSTKLEDLIVNDGILDFDNLPGSYIYYPYTNERRFLKVEKVKSSIYNQLKNDEFNNITTNRFDTLFYFMQPDPNKSWDPGINYFITKQGDLDINTSVYDTTQLSSSDTFNEIKLNRSLQVDNVYNYHNELVTHGSLFFIQTGEKEKLDSVSLNADVVNFIDYEIGSFPLINVKDFKFKIAKTISTNKSHKIVGENSFSVMSNYKFGDNFIDDEFIIIEKGLDTNSKRKIIKKRSNIDSESNVFSKTGKKILQNIATEEQEASGFLLKKTDDLVVGINSFSGFNSTISYVRLKERLKITLIGREVDKKFKNDSFESNSIKKMFVGNQSYTKVEKVNKNKKYFEKSTESSANVISDSVLPNVIEIYYDLAQKQTEETFDNDTLDEYLKLDNDTDNFNNFGPKTNKIIFSNKKYLDEENNPIAKYSSILNNWQNEFYLSRFKSNNIVSKKSYKNLNALLKEKKIQNPTYVYFDINSYSLNHKYDRASLKTFDKICNQTGSYIGQNYSMSANNLTNHHIVSTIRKHLVPIEYEKSIKFPSTDPSIDPVSYITHEVKYMHSGVPLEYYDYTLNNIDKNSLLTNNTINEENKIFTYSASPSAPLTFQYLNIPAKIYSHFDLESTSRNIKENHDKDSWCLVFENKIGSNDDVFSQIKEKIEPYFSKENINKVDYYKKITSLRCTDEPNDGDVTTTNAEILFDETFQLISRIDAANTLYHHKFYVIKSESTVSTGSLTVAPTINNFFYIVIPLQYVDNTGDDTTCDTTEGFSVDKINKFLGVDFTSFDKTQFEFCESNNLSGHYSTYRKIPKEPENMNKPYIIDNLNIDFYKPTFNLKHSRHESLKNPIYDRTKNLVISASGILDYKVDSLSHFDMLDKKNYAVNIDYFVDRTSNYSKNFYKNKFISTGFIYKKVENTYIKTKNKIIYEIIRVENYPEGVNDQTKDESYINIIGILNKEGKFDTSDLSCMILYDISHTDTIRIYDERLKEYSQKYNMNFNPYYVEIDLSSKHTLFNRLQAAGNSIVSNNAIKYSHYASDSFLDFEEDNERIINYGSPIANVNDTKSVNNFIYSYSRNKKYKFPIDQTSGYRYGVYNPNPVKNNYYFNSDNYGQFKDKSYATQNYAVVVNVNNVLKERHCIHKKYVNENYRYITKEEVEGSELFIGSNLDIYDRVYHPYIESKDNSDMTYLYT